MFLDISGYVWMIRVDINGRINRICMDIDGRIWTTQVSKPLGYYEVDTD